MTSVNQMASLNNTSTCNWLDLYARSCSNSCLLFCRTFYFLRRCQY